MSFARSVLQAVVLLCVLSSSAISAWAKPNFVFFMTDDQRFDQMGCAGHPYLRTPHMDRLASEGARFRNAYVVVSLCGPNRACIMTGLYSHANGVRFNERPDVVDPKIPMFPQLLQKAGYETAFLGKWHMPDAARSRDFDYYCGFLGQGSYWHAKLAEGSRNVIGPDIEQAEGHVDDIFGDRAEAFVRRKHDKPFCLFVWFKSPHRYPDPPERHADLYRSAYIPDPPTLNDDYAGRPEPVRLTEMKIGWTSDTSPWREFVRRRDACVKGVDDNVGKVLKALDETGLAANTAVIFTSDNGFFQGEHGFFDKRLMYEESIRVPMLVRWPGVVKPGSLPESPALSIDYAPTLLEAAGAEVPKSLQGRSLLPVLRGETPKDWRRRWWYEYDEFPGPHMVRAHRGVKVEERWKYIVWLMEPGGEELYDLQTDPHEMKNLVNDPGSKDLLARMRKEFRGAKEEAGDPTDVPAMKGW